VAMGVIYSTMRSHRKTDLCVCVSVSAYLSMVGVCWIAEIDLQFANIQISVKWSIVCILFVSIPFCLNVGFSGHGQNVHLYVIVPGSICGLGIYYYRAMLCNSRPVIRSVVSVGLVVMSP
jgi:hypothetical protein